MADAEKDDAEGGSAHTSEGYHRSRHGKSRDSKRHTRRKPDEQEDEEEDSQDKDQDQEGDDEQDVQDEQEDEKQKQKKPFWKRPWLLGSMIAAVVLIGVGVLIWWLIERNYVSTDDAFIDGHIIHVAPRVSGRVLSLNVNDNQLVHADDAVINIDPAPFQAVYDSDQAMLAQAQAKVAQAQADLAVQKANADQARAAVLVAQANATVAEQDYQRYKNLAPAARTQHEFDAAEAQYRSTQAQLVEARQKVASADAQVGAAQTAIQAARAQVAQAMAELAQAGLNLEYCNVTAGQTGYVTRRTVEKGNFVTIGQEILDIVPTDVWVTANFKETQLTHIRLGQPAKVTIDAYPGRKYRAHVDSIQAGTGAVFSVLPPENATGNFIKIVQRVPVKIIFDEPLAQIVAPGESVEPVVDIHSGK